MDRRNSAEHVETYHTVHDPEGERTLGDTIFAAIATMRDGDTSDRETLETAIDLDALEDLLASIGESPSQDTGGRVEFTVDGCQVTVTSSGVVSVRREPRETPAPVYSPEEFQIALARLIRETEANGVDVEGGWACRDGSNHPTWGIEIYEVEDS